MHFGSTCCALLAMLIHMYHSLSIFSPGVQIALQWSSLVHTRVSICCWSRCSCQFLAGPQLCGPSFVRDVVGRPVLLFQSTGPWIISLSNPPWYYIQFDLLHARPFSNLCIVHSSTKHPIMKRHNQEQSSSSL